MPGYPSAFFGPAIAYALRYLVGITSFVGDGRVEIDRSLANEGIKSMTLRKSELSLDGALRRDGLAVETIHCLTLTSNEFAISPMAPIPELDSAELTPAEVERHWPFSGVDRGK